MIQSYLIPLDSKFAGSSLLMMDLRLGVLLHKGIQDETSSLDLTLNLLGALWWSLTYCLWFCRN